MDFTKRLLVQSTARRPLHLCSKIRRISQAANEKEQGFNRNPRKRHGALLCQIANVAARLSSMPKQANKATKTAADQARRNPGLKDRRAAVRTSSTSRQANRAIKIADYFRGRFVRPSIRR